MIAVRGEVLVLLSTLKRIDPPATEVMISQGALEDAVKLPVQTSHARLAGTDGASPPVEVPCADTFAENVCTMVPSALCPLSSFAFTSAPRLTRYATIWFASRAEAPCRAVCPLSVTALISPP